MMTTTNAGSQGPAVKLEGVSKRFGATVALDDVTFEVATGSVHALLGGNGCGKSTLIKTLCGVYQADAGWIELAGDRHPADRTTPAWARGAGVNVVHQGLGVFGDLSVADNFALSTGYGQGLLGPISARRLNHRVREILERFEVDVAPEARMGDLASALQTMVAVARALADADEPGRGLLILDEPTAALPHDQREILLEAIRGYRRQGHTVLLVTHHLDEVTEVADAITFMRDGRHIRTGPAAEFDEAAMVRQITGDDASAAPRSGSAASPACRVDVRDLHIGPLSGVSLQVREGEVLGLSGLLGSGRSSLMLSMFGVLRPDSGEILLDGEPLRESHPAAAVRRGIAYVSADRQGEGQFPDRSVRENLSISDLSRYWRGGSLRGTPEKAAAQRVVEEYGVVVADVDAPVSTMSGGNQQKIAIARWLELRPRVLLLNEPTQGVDVGARASIHSLVRKAAADGMTVLVSSSDPRELTELCDRVVGLAGGRITGEAAGDEITAERCLQLALGATTLPAAVAAGSNPIEQTAEVRIP